MLDHSSLGIFAALNDTAFQSAAITAVCALVGTYITVKYRTSLTKKTTGKPHDRLDTIFDGYEKLIFQQQQEMQRKSEAIDLLEKAVTRLSAELETTQELLKDARDDLIRSQQQNESLSRQLQQMKQEYAEG